MWGELGSLSSHEDINDNDYVDIDINSDSEDKMRSSFSKNLSSVSKLVAVGSPQARDTTGMTDSQKEAIEREDRILRKKWTNTPCWQRLKKNKIGSLPQSKMGHGGDTLRPLVKVEKYPLCQGQMFTDKNTF